MGAGAWPFGGSSKTFVSLLCAIRIVLARYLKKIRLEALLLSLVGQLIEHEAYSESKNTLLTVLLFFLDNVT